MTEYKTVMYLDSEVHLIQDDGVINMLQCAATGKLLMTAGYVQSIPIAVVLSYISFFTLECFAFLHAVSEFGQFPLLFY